MPEGTWNTLMQRSPAPSSSAASEVQPGVTLANARPARRKPARPNHGGPEYRQHLLSETMVGSPSAVCWQIGTGWLRNYTRIHRARIEAELQKPLEIAPKADGRVEVLIMHTHATESYEDCDAAHSTTPATPGAAPTTTGTWWRWAMPSRRSCARLALGWYTDTQQFDYPSYNGSYDRAAAVVRDYLTQYPEIQLVLDIHRDGIQRDATTIVKPATEINGESGPDHDPLRLSPQCRRLGGKSAHRRRSAEPAGEPLPHPDPVRSTFPPGSTTP